MTVVAEPDRVIVYVYVYVLDIELRRAILYARKS